MIKIFVMCRPSCHFFLCSFLHGWSEAVWCAGPCGLLHLSWPSVNLTPKLALLIPAPCGGKQGPRCRYLGLRGWRRTIACWAAAPWAGLKQSNPLCSETGEQQHSCPRLHKQCFLSVGNLRATRSAPPLCAATPGSTSRFPISRLEGCRAGVSCAAEKRQVAKSCCLFDCLAQSGTANGLLLLPISLLNVDRAAGPTCYCEIKGRHLPPLTSPFCLTCSNKRQHFCSFLC